MDKVVLTSTHPACAPRNAQLGVWNAWKNMFVWQVILYENEIYLETKTMIGNKTRVSHSKTDKNR